MTTTLPITNLGANQWENPILQRKKIRFAQGDRQILINPHTFEGKRGSQPEHALAFEIGAPSEKIFFDPKKTKVLMVTCGGLCPGMNAVIYSLFHELHDNYRVEEIYGLRFGYQGFNEKFHNNLMKLDAKTVRAINQQGGTILGTSRGTPTTAQIVDYLEKEGINIFFTIGGDGTMRGAHAICEEARKRELPISVIGIPKTIDNDVPYVKRSFGFETAVEKASFVVRAAKEEATGVRSGIGMVKLMGRHSGYISAFCALATEDIDICLVPEVEFSLEDFLDEVETRLQKQKNLVIVVSEGAGQKFFEGKEQEKDASGNLKLFDIGGFLKDKIMEYLSQKKIYHSLKYIEPSYMIRSSPPNLMDQLFCSQLARHAVHAGMAGKTDMLVGYWHGRITYVPLATVIERGRQEIDPDGELWFNVTEVTRQTVATQA